MKNKIKEMYMASSFKRERKEDKKEILLVVWSTIWRTAVFTLFVLGGYKLATLWYHHFPENFPIKWMVGLVGGEIGAAVCLLLVILPMSRRRKK